MISDAKKNYLVIVTKQFSSCRKFFFLFSLATRKFFLKKKKYFAKKQNSYGKKIIVCHYIKEEFSAPQNISSRKLNKVFYLTSRFCCSPACDKLC